MSNDISCELKEFDDGHSPGSTDAKTKMAYYTNKNSEDFLTVFDHLLSDVWCSRAYNFAAEQPKPWGVYITTQDALDKALSSEDIWNSGDFQRAISLVAVRALLFERGKSTIGRDIKAIHGTAVWCLSSGLSNSVNYHVDYAELFRYENNIIHPPLYAGTCHVSPLNDTHVDGTSGGCMSGGDFQANICGLDHYRKFGYKGRLASKQDIDMDMQSAAWMSVRYRRNRGILHDGNFPHQSTPVTGISPGVRRVILGFNCFTAELSECNLRAPEHSDAFNRTIRLYQTVASIRAAVTAAPSTSSDKYTTDSPLVVNEANRGAEQKNKTSVQGEKTVSKGFSVADLKSNPALARLLVTAAKKLKAKELGDKSILES